MQDATPSMLGTGYNGKWLIVQKKPEYAVEDDVVFGDPRSPTKTTIHRVTAVKPGFVYTKGIKNGSGDGWLPAEKIIGHVVMPKRKM